MIRLLPLLILLVAPSLTSQTLVRLWDREITAAGLSRANEQRLKDVTMKVEEMFEERYLRENGLEPPQKAFDVLRRSVRDLRNEAQENDSRPETRTGPREDLMEWFVQRTVRSYYLSRALWEKHGGRIVLSAFGPCMAKDGLVQELRALEHAGSLTFPGGERFRQDLYRYILGQPGDGVLSGPKARKFFSAPPWEAPEFGGDARH